MLKISHAGRRRSKKICPVSPSHTISPPSSMKMNSISNRSDLSCVSIKVPIAQTSVLGTAAYSGGSSGDSFNLYVVDLHRRIRPVAAVARHRGNLVRHVLTFHDFAKNRVPVVQPRCRGHRNKKLAAVGIRSGIGHGKLSRLRVLERRMKLICELVSRPAHPRSVWAASLNHEVRNDAVENQPVVKRPLLLFSGLFVCEFLGSFRQTDEILNRLRRFFIEQ